MRRHGSLVVIGLFALAALAAVGAAPALSQTLYLPPNVILPNNEGLPIGSLGGLEGNAFVARVADPTAGWFNPAGLAAAPSSSASVSAGTFRFVSVTNDAASDSGGSSVRQLPAAVGLLYKKPWGKEDLTLGFTVARTAAWSQSTDAQILVPGALRAYTTLSADSEFDRTTVAISAAWARGTWRFGAGLLGDILSLRDVQAASYRQETGGAVQTSVGSYRATGSQGMIRLGLGAQADLAPGWKFGAVLRTPGVRILPSGVYAVDVVGTNGSKSQQATFFDGEADFQYKLPFEASLGIAWVRPTFEVELDVRGQTAVSAYDGFASSQPVVFIADGGTGSQAVVTTTPFPGRKFEGRAIVNVSLGGWLRLDDKGIWKLHGGFSTDQSPVGSGDQFFSRVNLSNVTVGLGGAVGKIAGSLGLTYQFGTTDDVTVVDASGGNLARTKFKISNFGILYSLSYAF
jgi:hypothetical protein